MNKLTTNRVFTYIVSVILVFALSSCNKQGCLEPGSLNYEPDATEDSGDCEFPMISLNLNSVVGNEDFAVGQIYEIGGVKVSFNTFQFYMTGVQLGTDALEGAYLIKAEQETITLGEATTGTKDAFRFDLGVDSTTNHLNPEDYESSNPLSFQAPSMHWSWDNGYIFLRVDGLVDADGDGTPEAAMEFHIGKDSNLTPVSLSFSTDANSAEVPVNVTLDIAKLFTNIDLSVDYITHTGDVPELANRTVANMASMFSIQ